MSAAQRSSVPEPGDPTISATGSPNLIGPRLSVPYLGQRPQERRPAWFIGGVFLAQFGIFLALLGPATVSIALKVTTLTSDPAQQAAWTGTALAPGALAAVIFNAVGGRISDRTTSRFGRRRPWLVIGFVGFLVAMLVIALGTNVLMLAVGWFLAQMCANVAFAAFLASLSDQLPQQQYGKTSGIVGIAQNVGIMGATWVSSWFESNMLLLFLVPAVIGFVLVVAYALTLPEPVLKQNRHPFNLREFLGTFWTNPIRHPDFALAWWGRFMIILASYLFVTFRLFYMTNHLGLDRSRAAAAVALGVTIYTVASMVASLLAGWISDATGRRKVLVAAAILLFAIGTYLLLHVDSVTGFYVVEAVMGFAYGSYVAVDLALVFEVLPDRENNGKDLGVFNMANALPQSIAPAVGGVLLSRLGGGTDFTALLITAAAVGVLGAILTMFIRSVR
ncbi:Na+/melibiose symporter-like transporter [Propionibacteriaceae bacterium ES.041]|uniref:MFS transporter n=1 Tax=Enemella evansiae TaxID=2016499 RepID=UPI000B97229E|nr:MFS transporter [Enemella evansiae]PFG68318.1 Na+/melibiose symporter-like transporter [Propionibacteriaceae bacterium ES.041]OYN97723.1 MFS transporter [Enemella evansiae]OYO03054.1 MFS transporter [Enemella evansiae]OYO10338.1 MFS transporter [Enemella evansiae]TDO87781.1 Na+/melibiose symporter-like transporter [Enemella evansiae]